MNQIDLEYLTNPHLKKTKKVEKNISKEIAFYKDRILSLTNQLLLGEKINNHVMSGFNKYAWICIEHLKFLDKKNVIQEHYKDLLILKKNEDTGDIDLKNVDKKIFFKKKKDIAKLLNIKSSKKKLPFIPQQLEMDANLNIETPSIKNQNNKYEDTEKKKKKKKKKKKIQKIHI
tara:strand:+ start:1144 stop:1665 length:522 start_codon:yes stop_codon:yes gene_type:complete